jgi:hypothetical protein
VILGAIFVLLMTMLSVFDGMLLIALSRARLNSWMRLAAGTVVGLALLVWVAFLTALAFGLGGLSIGVACAVLLLIPIIVNRFLPLGLFLAETRLELSRWDGPTLVYYALWAMLLAALFSRVVMFEDGGLSTAPLNNYGDLPFHLSGINAFAIGENLPPQNPIFAGLRFTYPFLIDFLTAFFLRAGTGLSMALFIENFALALALVAVIEFWTRSLTGNRLAGRIAPILLLFNGGLGFLKFFGEIGGAPSLTSLLEKLPHAYTMNTELATPFGTAPLRWGNVFTTLIIPQRSLLFGLPFVALILAYWWLAIDEDRDPKLRSRWMATAGILTGMLPLLHAHGFFSVMVASPLIVAFTVLGFSQTKEPKTPQGEPGKLTIDRSWVRDWVWFYLPAIILAGPQALYLRSTPVRNQLFKFHLGWESGESSVILFWLVNAGVFLVLLVAALVARGLIRERARQYTLIFLLWFIVPNLVLLAPWPWDNIKMFIYWALASTPLVALLLAIGFQRGIIWKAGAAALFAALTFSGALDVLRGLSAVEKAGLFGRAELEVAELLKAQTPPRAVIAHAPIHNSVICLTGRQSLMGYPGHLWTHGIDYQAREADLNTLYHNGPETDQVLARYAIDYLLVGPPERSQLNPPEDAFNARYETVFDQAGYKLYRVKK